MKNKILSIFGILLIIGVFWGCGSQNNKNARSSNSTEIVNDDAEDKSENSLTENDNEEDLSIGKQDYNVTEGISEYRGFEVDNVLHSETLGDIHFNLYVPESYDGSESYALYLTLPGYQGLYFQGVAQNIKTEEFGFEAQKYNQKMIIVAPQLEDWGETSANKTIELTEYFLKEYNIDPKKVYASGYSGGGETMSLVMGKRPDLFTAYLQCSSQWDGDFDKTAQNHTPVYFVVGEKDEYYGCEPSQEAYDSLHELYVEQGMTESEIDKILILDIKKSSYFTNQGLTYQHGGGNLFAKDSNIMGWLFNQNIN